MGANNDDDTSAMLESQIAKNNAEIEEKTQTMANERLDLMKSQGAPNWDAARALPVRKFAGNQAETMGYLISRGLRNLGK